MKISPQIQALLPLHRDGHRHIASKDGGAPIEVYSGFIGFAAANELESVIVTSVNSHEALVAALTECLANTGGGWISASVIDRARAALALAGAA